MKKLLIVLVVLLGLTAAAWAQNDTSSPTTDPPAPLPPCADLFHADLRVRFVEGALVDGAIYCRQLASAGKYLGNPGELGNQDVISMRVQEAYDVYGLYEDGTSAALFGNRIEVCLQGRGTLLYLPAFASPRPPETPLTIQRGDYTCATVGSPGILALIGG